LLFLTMLISMLTYSASALQKEKETFESLLKHGAELYKDRNYDDAIRELKKARMLNADSAEVKFLLSLAYRGKHQRTEAIEFAEQAIKLQPVYPDAHYVLAVLYYEDYKAEYISNRTASQNSFKQAKENLQTAIKQGAKSANVFELKGLMEFEELNFAAALESYKEALGLATPQFPELKKLRQKAEQLTKLLDFKQQHYSEVDLKPKSLNRPMPNYTERARQDRVQGMVAIFVKVDERGGRDSRMCAFSSARSRPG
jgi:tetratricopeptide (TPR) repeat protein